MQGVLLHILGVLPLAEVMKHEWVLRMVDIENKKRMKQ